MSVTVRFTDQDARIFLRWMYLKPIHPQPEPIDAVAYDVIDQLEVQLERLEPSVRRP